MVIGTGLEKFELDNIIISKLKSLDIKFDVLDTFRAVSTFNVSNEDNMNIMAFLLPGSEYEAPEEDPRDNGWVRGVDLVRNY